MSLSISILSNILNYHSALFLKSLLIIKNKSIHKKIHSFYQKIYSSIIYTDHLTDVYFLDKNQKKTIYNGKSINCLCFQGNQELLIGDDKKIVIYNILSHKVSKVISHSNEVFLIKNIDSHVGVVDCNDSFLLICKSCGQCVYQLMSNYDKSLDKRVKIKDVVISSDKEKTFIYILSISNSNFSDESFIHKLDYTVLSDKACCDGAIEKKEEFIKIENNSDFLFYTIGTITAFVVDCNLYINRILLYISVNELYNNKIYILDIDKNNEMMSRKYLLYESDGEQDNENENEDDDAFLDIFIEKERLYIATTQKILIFTINHDHSFSQSKPMKNVLFNKKIYSITYLHHFQLFVVAFRRVDLNHDYDENSSSYLNDAFEINLFSIVNSSSQHDDYYIESLCEIKEFTKRGLIGICSLSTN